MKRVIVLGGCGAVGRVVVRTLVSQAMFSDVVIGDLNVERAKTLAKEPGMGKVSVIGVDASDPQSVWNAVNGCDLVVNCVGPFYKTVKTVLGVVIESGINYVDVCDDVDVTLDILEMDRRAKEKGVSALIGMGSSPGATNLLAKFASDSLLDETDSIDIFHGHGGEPFEGEGVIGHRFHCMSIDIPMYLNGKIETVKFFGEDGLALRQTFDFPVLGKGVKIYPYPHPEQVTLPRYIKTRQVTNKGTVLPDAYYELTMDMCRLGLSSKDKVMVNGTPVVPAEFATAFIIRERERILKDAGFGSQKGCCSVVVKGKKEGKLREYRFHMASESQALGEGTGIPAAVGAILMCQGKITEKGVLPPEACVNPMDFIGIIPEVMTLDTKKQGGKSFGGVIIEEIDEWGHVKHIDL